MGLHDDVADILDDKSEEEEEKKIDCSGISKNVKIIDSLVSGAKIHILLKTCKFPA